MAAGSGLWRGAAPLLLASTSATRRTLLEGAGIPVETDRPALDERATEASSPTSDPAGVALHLARQKALAVSRRRPERLVLGADQALDLDGAMLHKPVDRAEAAHQLRRLAGRSHALHSAVALAHGGEIQREGSESAGLAMREIAQEAIARYLDLIDDAVLTSVGVYQVEGLGIHLFASIDGNHSTILGLPLLPVLAALRSLGLLAF
jgi:septum formation protein